MKITILGSGSFFVDKNHSAPAYLLEFDDNKILFDCGPGTQNQLAKAGVDPLDIEYIFLSHFHNDHTSDLVAILMRALLQRDFYNGKLNHSIKVVGPKGIKEFVHKLVDIQGHVILKEFDAIEFIDYKGKMEFDDFVISSFPVTHLGMDASALRMTVDDKVLAYTGDAEYCEGVEAAARDADLLIADSATPKRFMPASAHMATLDVGKVCKNSNVKKVILTHQVPPGYDVDMVSEVKEVFDGEVVLAKDLMEIEL